MLYTAVPYELIFADLDKIEQPRLVTIDNIEMEVLPAGEGMVQIVRLITCSLHHYLDEKLAPGKLIRY